MIGLKHCARASFSPRLHTSPRLGKGREKKGRKKNRINKKREEGKKKEKTRAHTRWLLALTSGRLFIHRARARARARVAVFHKFQVTCRRRVIA